MKIAFLGLGKMGAAMARNLMRAGHEVAVYNRSRDKAEALAAEGARVAATAADACRDCEAAHTMLADDAATEQTALGAGGAAEGLAKGAAHICHGTISTRLARRLAKEHETRGQGYLSAPVFGRPEAAEARKLIVVPAGPSELVEKFRPLFDAMGRQTIVAGTEAWQANALKVCGNFMIASMLESFGEALAVLRKSGVAPEVFLDAMNSLFASPVYANYGGLIAGRKFEPAGFQLRLGLKDVRLALEAAEECGAPLPIASLIRDHMISAMAHGQSEMDWSSLAVVAERAAGIEPV
jgi:3-hydroxyisobutyrate dehydrogenase-like beta-hydroxyacid dehydrogenase